VKVCFTVFSRAWTDTRKNGAMPVNGLLSIACPGAPEIGKGGEFGLGQAQVEVHWTVGPGPQIIGQVKDSMADRHRSQAGALKIRRQFTHGKYFIFSDFPSDPPGN
jgi:hypothetical protein